MKMAMPFPPPGSHGQTLHLPRLARFAIPQCRDSRRLRGLCRAHGHEASQSSKRRDCVGYAAVELSAESQNSAAFVLAAFDFSAVAPARARARELWHDESGGGGEGPTRFHDRGSAFPRRLRLSRPDSYFTPEKRNRTQR